MKVVQKNEEQFLNSQKIREIGCAEEKRWRKIIETRRKNREIG